MEFNFKGISSKSKGLVVIKLPSIEINQREYEEVNVLGSDKAHIIEKNYLPTRKKIEVAYFGTNYDDLSSFLNGTGNLILSSMSDRYYKARVDNTVKFDTIISNKLSKFVINFLCQPFSYLSNENAITYRIGNNNYINRGTVYSCPIIKVYGNGNVTISVSGTNEKGQNENKTCLITGVVGSIFIDTENLVAYKGDSNLSSSIKGEYPVLYVGSNNIVISGSGVDRVVIEPNTRFLI